MKRSSFICKGGGLSRNSVWQALLAKGEAGGQSLRLLLLPVLVMFGLLLGSAGAWAAADLQLDYDDDAIIDPAVDTTDTTTAAKSLLIDGTNTFVTVGNDGTASCDGTTDIDFGLTPLGTPVSRYFRMSNPNSVNILPGTANAGATDGEALLPGTPVLPAGFELVGFDGSEIAADASGTVFEIKLTADAAGTYGYSTNGEVTFSFGTSGVTGGNSACFEIGGIVDTGTATAGGEIMLEDITDSDPGVEMVDGAEPYVDFPTNGATTPTQQGVAVTRTFRITNVDGTEDLNVSGISFTNNECTIIDALPDQILIPGATATFNVQFKATEAGTIDPATDLIDPVICEMIISNSDSDEGPFNTTLQGYVEAAVTPTVLPEIDVADTGANIADNTEATFPSTFAGAPVEKTFTITNTGDADLDLKSLTIGGVNASVFSWRPAAGVLPDLLAPAATTDFIVTFSPTVTGNYKGLVQIFSNDADENPFDIPLTATAASAEKEITVSETAMGSFETGATVDYTATTPTVIGTPVTKTFTITNIGGTTLTINSIALNDGCVGFTILATPKALDPAGGASDSLNFNVTLDATEANSFQCTVSIGNDDTDENPFTFNVLGDVAASLTEPEVMLWEVLDDGTLSEITDDQIEKIDFSASTGETVQKEFRIKNLGGVILSLEGFDTLPKGFKLIGEFPINLQAGETKSFILGLDTSVEANYGGDFTFFNDDPDENPFTFPIGASVLAPAPEIEVLNGTTDVADGTTVAVEFGPTGVGSSVSKTFTVKNTGDADLNLITPVTFSEGGDGFTITSFNPSLVTAGSSQTFTVTLNATAAGTFTGTISFGNNDADENPYTFPVSGVVEAITPAKQEITLWDGTQAEVAAGTAIPIADGTSTIIEFGTTEIGTPLTQTFTVQNLGLTDLHLYGMQRPECYTLVGGALPPVVPTGGQISFDLQIPATKDGVCEGRIELFNDDADETPYDFPVHGVVGGSTIPAGTSLTVTITGDGAIARAPAGTDCGANCTSYDTGSTVTLTATPNAGATFTNWGGACAGTTATTTVTMDAAKSCTATFTGNGGTTTADLTVTISGSGTVTPNPAGTSCGANCTTHNVGTAVTLTATAGSGATFTNWGGACTGATATTTVTMDAAKNCTATFSGGTTPPPPGNQQLTVTKVGTGTITSDVGGINCGLICSASYTTGSIVQLTASGGTFSGWSGSCSGTSATTVVTMDAAKNCTATFSGGTTDPGTTDPNVSSCFNQGGIFADGVCLPASNLQPGAVDASGAPISVTVSMKGGISKNGGPYLKESTVVLADPIATRGVIQVDPADVGKKVDIIVAGIHYSTEMYPRGFEWYMLEGCNTCVKVWPYSDRDAAPILSQLTALKTVDVLPSTLVVDMYSGHFVFPGFLDIFYGYRVVGSGKVVFNADPIKVTINP